MLRYFESEGGSTLDSGIKGVILRNRSAYTSLGHVIPLRLSLKIQTPYVEKNNNTLSHRHMKCGVQL